MLCQIEELKLEQNPSEKEITDVKTQELSGTVRYNLEKFLG